MVRAASIGLWLALIVSFGVSAGIIGLPFHIIMFEIVTWTLLILAVVLAVMLTRTLLGERHGDDGTQSSA